MRQGCELRRSTSDHVERGERGRKNWTRAFFVAVLVAVAGVELQRFLAIFAAKSDAHRIFRPRRLDAFGTEVTADRTAEDLFFACSRFRSPRSPNTGASPA